MELASKQKGRDISVSLDVSTRHNFSLGRIGWKESEGRTGQQVVASAGISYRAMHSLLVSGGLSFLFTFTLHAREVLQLHFTLLEPLLNNQVLAIRP